MHQQPIQAVASAALTLSEVMLKIFGFLRLLGETWLENEPRRITMSGWCTGSNVGSERSSVATDYTGPQPWKPFVIHKCIFMNNSYFHFTLLWFSIWCKSTKTGNKSNQTVLQMYYSRIWWKCLAENQFWFGKLCLPVREWDNCCTLAFALIASIKGWA